MPWQPSGSLLCGVRVLSARSGLCWNFVSTLSLEHDVFRTAGAAHRSEDVHSETEQTRPGTCSFVSSCLSVPRVINS